MAKYFPPHPTDTIIPFSVDSLGLIGNTAPTSAVWPSANRAIFVPFRIFRPTTFTKMFTINGAAVSGNVDVGIYDETGRYLISMGTTAHTGTAVKQEFNIADTQLGVGLFYMALALSNITGAFYRRATGLELLKSLGVYQMASAFPLPTTTVTFATVTSSYLPLFGLSMDTVI